jgi:hypothetical protein
MNKKLIVLFIIIVCIFFNYSFVFAEVAKGDFSIGLNYPGFGAKYFFSNKISGELKSQMENNIFVGGLRGYYYFSPKAKYLLFAGLEGDFVSFKGEVSEGTGFASEVFFGGEYFFTKRFSVQLDFGPAWISLADKSTSESVSGLEYVVNFGINYYFRREGKY